MRKLQICFIFPAIFLLLSCGEDEGGGENNVINPNGDSQLALIMRDMFDQHMAVKQQLMAGERRINEITVGDLHTLDATEPEKVKSPEYKAYASSYLGLLDEFHKSPPQKRIEMHNAAVQSCMNCHTALCPGPRVKIKKLFIKLDK